MKDTNEVKHTYKQRILREQDWGTNRGKLPNTNRGRTKLREESSHSQDTADKYKQTQKHGNARQEDVHQQSLMGRGQVWSCLVDSWTLTGT